MTTRVPITLPPARFMKAVNVSQGLMPALKSPGANPGNDIPGGRQAVMHDGLERRYAMHPPGSLSQHNGWVPLVLVFHGGGGNAGNAERMTGFTAKAEQEGFIVVYPEGTGRFRKKHLTWNAGHCCGIAMKRRVGSAAAGVTKPVPR